LAFRPWGAHFVPADEIMALPAFQGVGTLMSAARKAGSAAVADN